MSKNQSEKECNPWDLTAEKNQRKKQSGGGQAISGVKKWNIVVKTQCIASLLQADKK